MALLHTNQGGTSCPVCGGACASFTPTPHAATYPFLPGGIKPMAPEKTVKAPHRIFNDEGILVYGEGADVPADEAKKYGIGDSPDSITLDPSTTDLAGGGDKRNLTSAEIGDEAAAKHYEQQVAEGDRVAQVEETQSKKGSRKGK